MITFNFGKTFAPCTDCGAFSDIPGTEPHCLLDNKIYFDICYYPVSPCNRPLHANQLLELMNSLFWRSD